MKRKILFNQLFASALALTLAFTSCKKTENDDNTNDIEATSAIEVESATASSEAIFIINTKPAGATRDSVEASSLPASVATYLDANYSGYTIKKTFKVNINGAVDSYIAVIHFNGKPVGLKFDASGAFIKIFEQRERGQLRGKGWKEGGRFDGRGGKQRDTIAITTLPLAIKTYFQLSLANDTLLHAFQAKDNSIVVITANNGLYANAFSASNVFMKRMEIAAHKGKKTAIAQAGLPAKALTYLSTTYPAYTFNKAFSIRLNNTVQGYVALIDANNTRYAIQFNANGDFVKNVAVR